MTRNGKIARLPQDIREELNERILNGQTAEQLLDWLHEDERVWAVLEEHDFDPITDGNISEWKAGGYQCWLENKEARDMVVEIALKSRDLGEETLEENMGQCVGNLLMVEFIKMAKVLVQPEEDPEKRWSQLERVNRELARLRESNARDTWSGIQQKRCDWVEEDRTEAQEEKHAAWVKQQRLAEYRLRPAVAIMASGHKKEDWEAAWRMAAREVEIENDLPKGLLDRKHEGGYWYWDEEDEGWFWMAKAGENSKSKLQIPKKHQGPSSKGEKKKGKHPTTNNQQPIPQGRDSEAASNGGKRKKGKQPTSKHQIPKKRQTSKSKERAARAKGKKNDKVAEGQKEESAPTDVGGYEAIETAREEVRSTGIGPGKIEDEKENEGVATDAGLDPTESDQIKPVEGGGNGKEECQQNDGKEAGNIQHRTSNNQHPVEEGGVKAEKVEEKPMPVVSNDVAVAKVRYNNNPLPGHWRMGPPQSNASEDSV